MPSFLARMVDGLTNAITGLGGTGDPRLGRAYSHIPITQTEIEAMYRGSGLMRKVVEIPALDMTREWRDWQAPTEEIDKLEAEERRLGLQSKVYAAELLRGLGGGALLVGVAGQPEMPANPRAIKPQGIAYLQLISRWQLSLGEKVDVIEDPLFGGPRDFTITTTRGQQKIHPSRLICFKGDTLPVMAATTWEDEFWGDSRVARVREQVMNCDDAQGNFAALIGKARSSIIGIPGLSDLVSTSVGEARLRRRLQTMIMGESQFSATLRDAGDGSAGAGETIDHRQVNWAGIPEIMYAFATFLAAVADIPVTRLMGRAAEGMNASGQSQQDDWDKMVLARQNLFLRPCLDQLDAMLMPSAGVKDSDIWWEFAPLDTPTEGQEATRFKDVAIALKTVQDMGCVPDEAFAEAAQNTLVENGFMPGLDAALAKVPENERFGLNPDADETDPSAIQADPDAEQKLRRAANDARFADATPRTLYVCRKVVNVDEFEAWAKKQGIALQDDLHVTIVYSRRPLDWMKIEGEWNADDKGQVTIPPGGVRIVEPLGDRTAVLLFTSSALSWRHESIVRAGASHDYDDYQPHISLTGDTVDLSNIEPYRGKIVLGPEIFEEVDEGSSLPFVPDANPYHVESGPDGGQFTYASTAASFAKNAMANPKSKDEHLFGTIEANAPDHVLGFTRVMNAQEIRKNMHKHGDPEHLSKDQPAIAIRDFSAIDHITKYGTFQVIGARKANKPQRIEYRGNHDGRGYVYTEIVGTERQRTALWSFYRVK